MSMFDTYVMVDWSASNSPTNRPKSDAIWWVALRRCDGVYTKEVHFESTRHCATKHLRTLLLSEAQEDRRVLVGFDFAFGYPRGFLTKLREKFGGQGPNEATALSLWEWLFDRVSDDERNANDRFKFAARINRKITGRAGGGPFWGRPSNDKSGLSDGAPDCRHDPERRHAESEASAAKTLWQLHYAGSVGSQSLVGMRRLHELRNDPELGRHIVVWPFETGLCRPKEWKKTGNVVMVEIYPSLLPVIPTVAWEEILDATQMRLNALAFAEVDRQGYLETFFTGGEVAETRLSSGDRSVVEAEEGWILGLGSEFVVILNDAAEAAIQDSRNDRVRQVFALSDDKRLENAKR